MFGLQDVMNSPLSFFPGIFTSMALCFNFYFNFIFLYAIFSIASQHFTFSWSGSEEVLVVSVTVCKSVSGNSPPLMLWRSYLKA